MLAEALRLAGALAAAVVGGLVVHFAARRRDIDNERRRQRVDYLVSAYRTLARSAHRDLSQERAEAFEDALSDVIMLGSAEQIQLARTTMSALAEHRTAPLDNLLVSLRNALRSELALSSDGFTRVPIVRITTGPPRQHSGPLTLTESLEVSFGQQIARTGASLAVAAANSTRSYANHKSRDLGLQEIRALISAAPGAAVAAAFGRLTSELQAFLQENGSPGQDGSNASTLADVALDRGLVSVSFVDTVNGLTILHELAIREGSGAGLAPARANEYVDLAAAALYVLWSRHE